MGFIRWLKKEIDYKRRQSAPVEGLNLYDPNANRKEYLEKIRVFNQYRQQKYCISSDNNMQTRHTEHIYQFNDTLNNERLVSDNNNGTNDQTNSIEQNNKSFNNTETVKNNSNTRKSLPNKLFKSYRSRSFRKNTKNQLKNNGNSNATNNNNNNVNSKNKLKQEIEDFEQINCKPTTDSDINCVSSPPQEFYRSNSSPYDVTICDLVKSDDKGRQQKRQRELFRKQERIQTTSLPASADGISSSASTSSVLSQNQRMMKQTKRRKCRKSSDSPAYETIINIHGDHVEYALPYSDRSLVVCTAKRDKSPQENENQQINCTLNQYQCEEIVTESYKFLNNIDTDDNADSGISFQGPKKTRSNVIVTDLDKSLDSARTLDSIASKRPDRDDIFRTLNQLETFSKTLTTSSNHFITKDENSIIMCKPKEIKSKTSVLRSTFSSPLEFSSGVFRKNIVTLRNCMGRQTENSQLAEEAIQKDYQILSHIRHSNIILLMAASLNKKLINHMTLVLEPCDYTLHYFIFQMNEKISLFDTISITQQIASATIYLHECGYIHSNISSHCILMRKHPWCVKLSSFDLTTSRSVQGIRNEVESIMNPKNVAVNKKTNVQKVRVYDDSEEVYDKYKSMSKLVPMFQNTNSRKKTYNNIPTRFWQYNVDYRKHFSLYYYQAPELLVSEDNFIYPTVRADVYSLTILLWEILNNCVPFIVYTRNELEYLHTTKQSLLPIFNKDRCKLFMNIFEKGLEVDPKKRTINLEYIVSMLEEIKFALNSNTKNCPNTIECDYESLDNGNNENDSVAVNDNNNILNQSFYVNTDDFLSSIRIDPNDKPLPPLPINENATTDSNKFGNFSVNVSNATLYQSLLEFDRCLSDRKKDGTYERTSTLKKPNPKEESNKNRASKTLFDDMNSNINPKNTYNSIDDQLNIVSDDIKCNREDILQEFKDNLIGPVIVKENELPTPCKVDKNAKKFTEKNILNRCLSPKMTGTSKPKAQIVGWKRKDNTLPANYSSNGNIYSTVHITDGTSTTDTDQQKVEISSSKSTSQIESESLFSIATKNRIRRNAWLSNNKIESENKQISVDSHEKSSILNKSLNEPNNGKKLNVSIKIVHNKITPNKLERNVTDDIENTKAKLTKDEQSIAAESPPFLCLDDSYSPDTFQKICSYFDQKSNGSIITIGSTTQKSHPADEQNKLSASQSAIETQRKLSSKLSTSQFDMETKKKSSNKLSASQSAIETQLKSSNKWSVSQYGNEQQSESRLNSKYFEDHLWKREKELCNQTFKDEEPSVIVPKFISVKDTISQYENIEQNISSDHSLKAKKKCLNNSINKNFTSNIPQNMEKSSSPTSTSSPTSSSSPSSPSVDNEISSTNSATLIKKTIFKESIVSGIDIGNLDNLFDRKPNGKELTTMVTLNLRKSLRRSSDIGTDHLPLINCHASTLPNPRHSICLTDPRLNEMKSPTLIRINRIPSEKYICCECEAKLPQSDLRALTYRIPPTSSAEQLNERSSALVPNSFAIRKRNNRSQSIRSTEDLYIDDDYCHGLGANMELLADTSDLYDSCDFDIVSAEIIQTENLKS